MPQKEAPTLRIGEPYEAEPEDSQPTSTGRAPARSNEYLALPRRARTAPLARHRRVLCNHFPDFSGMALALRNSLSPSIGTDASYLVLSTAGDTTASAAVSQPSSTRSDFSIAI